MNSPSKNPSNVPLIHINQDIKKLINSYTIADLLCLMLINKNNYNLIQTYLKSHKTFSKFYKWTSYLSEEIKDAYIELEESNFGNNWWTFELWDKVINTWDFVFSYEEINKIINSTNHSEIGIFYDWIEDKTRLRDSYSYFMTIFLILQLHNDKFNLTNYINWFIFDRPLILYRYSWLTWDEAILNWYYKNSSGWQNHRLAAILMYNNVLIQLWLTQEFQLFKHIKNSNIKVFEKTYWVTAKISENKLIPEDIPKKQTTKWVEKGIKWRLKSLFGGGD